MRYLCLFLCVAFVSGCAAKGAGSSPVPENLQSVNGPSVGQLRRGPSLQRRTLSGHMSYATLYSFGGPPSDGDYPAAGLIDVNGTLYGTTVIGGADDRGTVFSVTTIGGERVLYSFKQTYDGTYPRAGLVDVNGTLYGTTEAGGGPSGRDLGTVFEIKTSGKERVLHNFGIGVDGAAPSAGLTNVQTTLYGTTGGGGEDGAGTVFEITTAGKESVLHSFVSDDEHDGFQPMAAVTDVNGSLYGTTLYGGAEGNGTVFSMVTSGKNESLLHSFGGPHGSGPMAGLLDVNGTLYGTTANSVFSITTAGKQRKYHVLHTFGTGSDGAGCLAGLIDVNGTLYGTTGGGGQNRGGTVFSITRTGKEHVLYSFGAGSSDGAEPLAGLVNVNGTLYGTTAGGGSAACQGGCGTVFALTL
jgi:uncharacterized repeat protein (TIGR03803 family)